MLMVLVTPQKVGGGFCPFRLLLAEPPAAHCHPNQRSASPGPGQNMCLSFPSWFWFSWAALAGVVGRMWIVEAWWIRGGSRVVAPGQAAIEEHPQPSHGVQPSYPRKDWTTSWMVYQYQWVPACHSMIPPFPFRHLLLPPMQGNSGSVVNLLQDPGRTVWATGMASVSLTGQNPQSRVCMSVFL